MIKVEMTIDGKPIADGLQDAILEAAIEQVKSQAMSVLSEEEASQLTLKVTNNGNELGVMFSGPDEIIEKITDAFPE